MLCSSIGLCPWPSKSGLPGFLKSSWIITSYTSTSKRKTWKGHQLLHSSSSFLEHILVLHTTRKEHVDPPVVLHGSCHQCQNAVWCRGPRWAINPDFQATGHGLNAETIQPKVYPGCMINWSHSDRTVNCHESIVAGLSSDAFLSRQLQASCLCERRHQL